MSGAMSSLWGPKANVELVNSRRAIDIDFQPVAEAAHDQPILWHVKTT